LVSFSDADTAIRVERIKFQSQHPDSWYIFYERNFCVYAPSQQLHVPWNILFLNFRIAGLKVRLNSGIVDSNPAPGIDICTHFYVLCCSV